MRRSSYRLASSSAVPPPRMRPAARARPQLFDTWFKHRGQIRKPKLSYLALPRLALYGCCVVLYFTVWSQLFHVRLLWLLVVVVVVLV
mmetsp:Transcript_41951/g.132586  ORF Transcript_41951/g.132586 Transcript_41951/m.132586 type:complete len:88 (+) Transcript_41951:296-559(+)